MSPRPPSRDADVLRDLRGKLDAETKKRAASDEVFRLLVESVEDYAMCMLDTTGRVATWNHGAERIYRYSADEIIGIHCGVFYDEESHCMRDLAAARSTGRCATESRRTRKDRSTFWANVVITPMRDGDGALLGFAQVTRDLERVLRRVQATPNVFQTETDVVLSSGFERRPLHVPTETVEPPGA